MVNPDETITIPEPKKEKSSAGQKLLGLFAILGVIGLGTCGYTLNTNHTSDMAGIGLILIGISVVGLVLTGIIMGIAAVTGRGRE